MIVYILVLILILHHISCIVCFNSCDKVTILLLIILNINISHLHYSTETRIWILYLYNDNTNINITITSQPQINNIEYVNTIMLIILLIITLNIINYYILSCFIDLWP